MARLDLTDLINAINNAIQTNTTGNITAPVLNQLLQDLTNNLYLPSVDTITVNGTGGVSTITFSGGSSVSIVNGVASVSIPAAYRGDYYGEMNITNNEANTVVIGAGQVTTSDALLPITYNTTYFKIPGYSGGLSGGLTYNPTIGGLQAPVAGHYKFSGWASVRHSANSATVGIVFGIWRDGTFLAASPRPTPARIPNTGNVGLISGEGLADLLAGDVIVPLIGSNVAGTVTINNSTLVGTLVGIPA